LFWRVLIFILLDQLWCGMQCLRNGPGFHPLYLCHYWPREVSTASIYRWLIKIIITLVINMRENVL
jgi:hypothetical protein